MKTKADDDTHTVQQGVPRTQKTHQLGRLPLVFTAPCPSVSPRSDGRQDVTTCHVTEGRTHETPARPAPAFNEEHSAPPPRWITSATASSHTNIMNLRHDDVGRPKGNVLCKNIIILPLITI